MIMSTLQVCSHGHQWQSDYGTKERCPVCGAGPIDRAAMDGDAPTPACDADLVLEALTVPPRLAVRPFGAEASTPTLKTSDRKGQIKDTSLARVTGYAVSCVVDPDRVVHHVCFALAKWKILEGHVTDGARSFAFESLCAERLAGVHDNGRRRQTDALPPIGRLLRVPKKAKPSACRWPKR